MRQVRVFDRLATHAVDFGGPAVVEMVFAGSVVAEDVRNIGLVLALLVQALHVWRQSVIAPNLVLAFLAYAGSASGLKVLLYAIAQSAQVSGCDSSTPCKLRRLIS